MATEIPEKVDLSKYVETRLMGDRPHVRGRRMPVAWVASAAQENGYDIADLMDNYTLSEEQVLAALLYYREHQEELDAQEARYQQEWDETYEQHGRK
jgi:uncharacterized protein (DUF433 family)